MCNHARGLWGYTGTAADGAPLTIQATGLGAASAAAIADDLFRLGVHTAIRVGTARTLPASAAVAAGGADPLPAPGDAFVVSGALAADGPSRALGARGVVAPDRALFDALVATGAPAGVVASADLPDPAPADVAAWLHAGARATDLQTATVLQLALRDGARAAAVLVVTGAAGESAPPALDDDAQLAADRAAAALAATALGIPARVEAPLPPPREDERETTGPRTA